MAKYEFRGKSPVVGKNSYVHDTAQLIGDIVIGENCMIAPGAAIRADFGPIRIGDRTSVQDNCALHCAVGGKLTVGSDITLGHACVLHGCEIGDRTVVGMNAVVADNTIVGEDCIIAEGSVVRGGQTIPPGSLVAGVPAAVKGQLKDNQKFRKDAGAKAYVELTRTYLSDLKKIED